MDGEKRRTNDGSFRVSQLSLLPVEQTLSAQRNKHAKQNQLKNKDAKDRGRFV